MKKHILLVLLFFLCLVTIIIIIRKYFLSYGLPSGFWSIWYNYIAKYDLQTMNYGYSNSINKIITDENENSLNLYRKVANIENLKLYKGDIILEVGCGRGGGIFHLASLYPDYTFIGCDFSKNAIDCAKNKFQLPNLNFEQGDAGSLAYKSNSISAVVNIESSHCYPDFIKFISEVKRILKPGGKFCYTDFKKNAFHEIQKQFSVNFVSDITPNVLLSLQNMTLIRRNQIDSCRRNGNFFDKNIIGQIAREFVGDINSTTYKNFDNGKTSYIHIEAVNDKDSIDFNTEFKTQDIRSIGNKKISYDYFKNKVNTINDGYKKMKFVQPQIIMVTNQKYSRKRLKTLSNDFTQPVLFKNCKINIDHFELNKMVQVKQHNHIMSINLEELKKDHNVFNQKINSRYLTNIKKIFKKEILYCDYFKTIKGHATGIHNEMNSSINLQIKGSKKWILIDPKFSDFLIPISFGYPKLNQYCSMNFGWDKLPNKIRIPHYEVTVEKGDLLFVPSWWWHHPSSITESEHISLRTVHSQTFHHHLFMPEKIYKLCFLLPCFYKNHTQTDNSYLNSGIELRKYYKDKGIKFLI